jgi:regulator of sigma E protease
VENIVHGLGLFGGGAAKYGLSFLFVLTIVVFVHEFGHFLIARLCGIKVMVFSIGFGRELWGFDDRYGTRWKISAIPLGGYVKFFGDENAASVPDTEAIARMSEAERRVSFIHQPVGPRAAVVAAGPMANFLLAIAIFAAVFVFYGRESPEARVDTVAENSAAAAAGFRPGDLVVAINDQAIDTFGDMQQIVEASAGQKLEVIVDREGRKVALVATPKFDQDARNGKPAWRLGLGRQMKPERLDPISALEYGVHDTWSIITQTLQYIGKFAMGKVSADGIGGPVAVAQFAGKAWDAGNSSGGPVVGLLFLFRLTAILSVSIGLLNLFPIPLLDGGHLLFYAIEVIRRRPLSERAQEFGFRIGMGLVAMLMIFALVNDGLRIFRNLAPS